MKQSKRIRYLLRTRIGTMSYALKSGDQLGEYQILEMLGAGGFGITYRAHSHQQSIEVAIKEYFPLKLASRGQDGYQVLANSNLAQTEYAIGLNRFKIETAILESFGHVNIVRILSFFEMNNTAYMVMEYVPGEDLDQYLTRVNRPITYDEILQVFLPVLDGLRAMHRKNVLHLDIKPDNILLRKNYTPCLIDFGGARHHAAEESSRVVSQVSFMVAADGFSPPEQYSQDKASKGPWSDVYSLAATVYSCMNNRQKLKSSEARMSEFIHSGKDSLPSAVNKFKNKYPQPLLELIDLCLSLKRDDRPQSAEELQNVLIDIANKQSKGTNSLHRTTSIGKKPSHNIAKQHPANKSQSFVGKVNEIYVYADLWLRLGAYAIDSLLLVLVYSILKGIITLTNSNNETRIFFLFGIFFIISWLYFAIMESSPAGGTIGKQIVRICVIDIQGKKISFLRSTSRYFIKTLSTLLFGLGFLMAGFTRRKQCLHDIVSDTLVIQKK